MTLMTVPSPSRSQLGASFFRRSEYVAAGLNAARLPCAMISSRGFVIMLVYQLLEGAAHATVLRSTPLVLSHVRHSVEQCDRECAGLVRGEYDRGARVDGDGYVLRAV